MYPEVTLLQTSRDDVQRLGEWLEDVDVNSSWYGTGEDGLPLHIGYSPSQVLTSSDDEWRQVFEDQDRRIYSVYTTDGQHIGEGQLEIEWPLQEARAFMLVGRKDLWHHHYGTVALIGLLDQAYKTLGLHRVWVDVPEYNEHAMQMCRHLGFILEGHLRKTHRKGDQWYDSFAMGLLSDEFARRRARLLGTPA
jgi:RimJ/RimL family protein N-acetyltransferase